MKKKMGEDGRTQIWSLLSIKSFVKKRESCYEKEGPGAKEPRHKREKRAAGRGRDGVGEKKSCWLGKDKICQVGQAAAGDLVMR